MGTYGTWKGTPREQVPWYPTVDMEKCAGCRTCYEFCGHGVYAWDDATDKPRIVKPFQCVVGCSSCSHQCGHDAISFPTLDILKPFLGGH